MDRYINDYYDNWFSVNEFYEGWAGERGLTANSLFVLYMLNETGGCVQKELCRRLLLPKQTVNGILKVFETAGYISKIQGVSDGRNKTVIFTDKGRKYANEILSDLHSLENAVVSSMTTEEKEGFVKYNCLFLERLRKFSHA